MLLYPCGILRLNMAKRPVKDHAKVAQQIEAGATLESALVAGGYSEATAKRGLQTVEDSAPLKRILIETGNYKGLTEKLSPEQIKDFVSAKLLENALDGKDKAAKSLELLGKQRGVDMFTPEQIVGGFIINVPSDWQSLFAKQGDSAAQKSRNR